MFQGDARGEGNVARSFALRCSGKQTLRITLHSPSADARRRVGRLTCGSVEVLPHDNDGAA